MTTTYYAIDFGAGDALKIHGPKGPISVRELKLPRNKPGQGARTDAQRFILLIEALMNGGSFGPPGHVVLESPTIGSSGCEVEDAMELVQRSSQKLFTVTARAVKNYRKDHGMRWAKGARYAKDGAPPPVLLTLEEQRAVHGEDAEIIYAIATEYPERLYEWTGPSLEIERDYTSVRPMDKRGYADPRSDEFIERLPPFEALPPELKDVLGGEIDKKTGQRVGYSRAKSMPFAMATDESFLDQGPVEERRGRWEKIIGLYDRGYPSFYRRATIVWMQTVAKLMTGAERFEEVSREQRKQAWKTTQRQIRTLFHMSMQHQGR